MHKRTGTSLPFLRVAGGTGEGRRRSIAVSTKEEHMQLDTSQVYQS
jgi:hypothetical protein